MKKKTIALKNIAVLAALSLATIACNEDFSTLDSDLINSDNNSHFNSETSLYDVITYNRALGGEGAQFRPVQSNNLPSNLLGIYDDPTYGRTTASFVTQLAQSTSDPSFGEGTQIDSVVMTIPFYSSVTGTADEGGNTYELDSIFGDAHIKLSLYESNYFLRGFDPNSEFNESQRYYSNGATSLTEMIDPASLEGTPIAELLSDTEPSVLDNFKPSETQIILTEPSDDEVAEGEEPEYEVTERLAPALRVKLDPTYWNEKIIAKEGDAVLSNSNNFNNYFRGIYFKVEAIGESGHMSMLNMSSTSANITIYYTKDPSVEDGDRIEASYTLTFSGNRVNFFENNFTLPLLDGDELDGDEKLYLKGGQGSMAIIKLFDGENIDENTESDNTFENFKNFFAQTDEEGKFVKRRRLINEANLVFHVDQSQVNGQEPDRIYLYDIDNERYLADYLGDLASTTSPLYSRTNHLGKLERVDDEADGEGIKYKLRITEHVKSLIENDSTNVKLGLVVSTNVNLEVNSSTGLPTNQAKMLTADDVKVPVSSVLSPRGTVLFGNNTPDEDKKVYLEIFYTEPEN
ncbi:DUF4270 domain-containing protein [Mangrovimonas sp. DI 80]|uniref:DUF4270 domain-containing protein n=1 Tax=Mangrovimonas sp. DI 80 TaxID=1779330 RepID=UPI0009779424|nr:DUF4270 domain-containing protein [Mangrovimonas sp. DI 80]OMP32527.1 hypothetical protein BKM32_05635 [Mangrovimonas sp. DI 80]